MQQDSETNQNHEPNPSEQPLTFWQVLGSTLAAAFGVQSSKNRERDFTRGKAHQFIFMGIGFTVIMSVYHMYRQLLSDFARCLITPSHPLHGQMLIRRGENIFLPLISIILILALS